ncbi:TetR/AcrR family transcriptional regulator, partial [Longimicrobium sp.]|uniref:TetR/AcrR family transcriptional regulator n=1 Tax=Longimicrobium sp. TaxID=2029185 RepID=UPI002E379603
MSEMPIEAAPPRRVPSQRRSRERVERMLAVATELIAERGSDAVRMSEVAERAGVSIGSLYQYFPDKSAIIRTLAERYNAQGLACVQAELAPVRDEGALHEALLRVVDGYYEMFLAEPVMRDIWWATQSDRALQDVDAADVEAHTA